MGCDAICTHYSGLHAIPWVYPSPHSMVECLQSNNYYSNDIPRLEHVKEQPYRYSNVSMGHCCQGYEACWARVTGVYHIFDCPSYGVAMALGPHVMTDLNHSKRLFVYHNAFNGCQSNSFAYFSLLIPFDRCIVFNIGHVQMSLSIHDGCRIGDALNTSLGHGSCCNAGCHFLPTINFHGIQSANGNDIRSACELTNIDCEFLDNIKMTILDHLFLNTRNSASMMAVYSSNHSI
mmetsp:Transcript_13447/g.26812  ORF Transcript_13447/g.26812 Transcript_13447/m.26812 type:complete len:234 (+) Transcript_13447:233-934(+)